MNKEELFEAWAPTKSVWSHWVKPVLFAQLPDAFNAPNVAAAAPSLSSLTLALIPNPKERCCVVVDLPGAESVDVGVALANLGYRPIPLFNSAVSPLGADSSMTTVDSASIQSALISRAAAVASLNLASDAPPAFLLDSLRGACRLRWPAAQQLFDNRSVVNPSDFPSARALTAQKIAAIIVLRCEKPVIGADLYFVLRKFQQQKIMLKRLTLGEDPQLLPLRINWLNALFGMVRVGSMTLSRQRDGSFGHYRTTSG